MFPIRTILHPTDFSEFSCHAFHLACALARDHNAEIFLLHVARPPVVTHLGGVIPPDSAGYRDMLTAELGKLEVEAAPLKAQSRLVFGGDPPTEILGMAEEINADVIILGTHGRSGLSRMLMGSVAEQVVRRAICPVLTVRVPMPELARNPGAEALQSAKA